MDLILSSQKSLERMMYKQKPEERERNGSKEKRKKNLRRARMTQVLKEKRQDPQFQKSVLAVCYILSLDN